MSNIQLFRALQAAGTLGDNLTLSQVADVMGDDPVASAYAKRNAVSPRDQALINRLEAVSNFSNPDIQRFEQRQEGLDAINQRKIALINAQVTGEATLKSTVDPSSVQIAQATTQGSNQWDVKIAQIDQDGEIARANIGLADNDANRAQRLIDLAGKQSLEYEALYKDMQVQVLQMAADLETRELEIPGSVSEQQKQQLLTMQKTTADAQTKMMVSQAEQTQPRCRV